MVLNLNLNTLVTCGIHENQKVPGYHKIQKIQVQMYLVLMK